MEVAPLVKKLYETHSGKTVFSRDVEFDERTPVAPLIEGETGVGSALDGGGTTGEKTCDGGALSGRSLPVSPSMRILRVPIARLL
jgi:hypothetical protein